jgi:hypothetical protein
MTLKRSASPRFSKQFAEKKILSSPGLRLAPPQCENEILEGFRVASDTMRTQPTPLRPSWDILSRDFYFPVSISNGHLSVHHVH